MKNEPQKMFKIMQHVRPQVGFSQLVSLNLTTNRISRWSDIDHLRTFPALAELRFKNSPLLEDYTAHERRMLLVACN
jgi:hypothetical protein